MSSEFQNEDVKTESSWAGPARILFITLILAAGFAYYYFGPSVEDIQGNAPKASTSREPVAVTIAGENLLIPQNYTQFGKTRRGGQQDRIDLYAIYPSFEGFTLAHQDDFEGNDSGSPIVHITLQDLAAPDQRVENEALNQRLTEREKFERIYLPMVVDPKGEPARYGFTRYRLSGKWGQKGEDLFVHEANDGSMVLFRCLLEGAGMPSPWCRRDIMLTDRLEQSYRFKRTRLSDWRDIDTGVSQLIERFRKGGASLPRAAAPQPATTPPVKQSAPPKPATQAPAQPVPAKPAPPVFKEPPAPVPSPDDEKDEKDGE